MKRIKALTIGLVLTMAGAVYAAGGAQQSTAESCEMNMGGESCCTQGASCCTQGASCCAGGGSCCEAKVAQKQ
jgi:hypothetical protein